MMVAFRKTARALDWAGGVFVWLLLGFVIVSVLASGIVALLRYEAAPLRFALFALIGLGILALFGVAYYLLIVSAGATGRTFTRLLARLRARVRPRVT